MGMARAEHDRRRGGAVPMGSGMVVGAMVVVGMIVTGMAMTGMVVCSMVVATVTGRRMPMRAVLGRIVPGMPAMLGRRRHRRGAGILGQDRRDRSGGWGHKGGSLRSGAERADVIP